MNTLTTFPYESSIGVKPKIVGYCPVCHNFEPTYHKGSTCWDDCTNRNFKPRKLIRRLMWECPWPDCDFWYTSYNALLQHEHGWV